MKSVITSIKSNSMKSYAAIIFCVFLYASTLFSGLTNNAFSSCSNLNINSYTYNQTYSDNFVSNFSINLETIHSEIPESHNDSFLAFESNENEEEVDSDKLGVESTQDNYHFSIPISTFLNNYSHQLSKRKIIPLFVLYSSWKSFIFS